MNDNFFDLIFFVGFTFLLVIAFVYSHEATHLVIAQKVSSNASIRFSLLDFDGTIAKTTYTPTKDLTNLQVAQANVEAIGYQIVPFLIIQTFFIFLIAFRVWFK